jgi:hypothetical protein
MLANSPSFAYDRVLRGDLLESGTYPGITLSNLITTTIGFDATRFQAYAKRTNKVNLI